MLKTVIYTIFLISIIAPIFLILFYIKPASDPLLSFFCFCINILAIYYFVFKVCNNRTYSNNKFRYLTLAILIIVGILIRFCFILYPISDDVYRYAWEGYIQEKGVNPYITAPEKLVNEYKNDIILQKVNHKDISAIYPPLAMYSFKLLSKIYYSLSTYKLFFIICDSILLLFLSYLIIKLNMPPHYLIIYAFNILILVFGVGESHIDILSLLFITISISCTYMNKKSFMSYSGTMLFLGMAVMTKYLAIVFLPLFITRKSYKYLPIFFIPFALFLPYIDKGIFNGLFNFSTKMSFNAVIPKIFDYINLPMHGNIILLLIILLFGTFIIWVLCQDNIFQGSLYSYFWLILCLPTVHYWYLMPLVLFSVFYQNRSIIIFTISSAFIFWTYNNYLLTETWLEFKWIWLAIHIPVLIVFVIDFLSSKRVWRYKSKNIKSIDIIIPTLNEENYIDTFINNLKICLKQFKKTQSESTNILFIDGGSTDLTIEKIKDHNYIALVSDSKGRGCQINYGINHTSGELILIRLKYD